MLGKLIMMRWLNWWQLKEILELILDITEQLQMVDKKEPMKVQKS